MKVSIIRKAYLFLLISLINCQTVKKNDYIFLGNQYARDGLLREAIESYRKSIAVEPKKLSAYRNMGVVLVKIGSYKEAVRALEHSLPLYEGDFETIFYLGEAFRGQEKFADAIYYYKKSLTISSNRKKALKALSWAYFRIRYYSEALETAKNLVKVDESDEQSAIIIARIHLKLKNFKEAFRVVRTAKSLAREENLPYLNSVEGDVYFYLGKYKKAQYFYRLALKKQPLLAGALLGLGKCSLREKKTNKAISLMEKALRIRPLLSEAHLYLGRAYERVNRRKALAHYRRFREGAKSDPEYLSMITEVKKKILKLKEVAN